LVAIYREAKQHAGPRYFLGNISDFGRIISAKCNANSTRVSLIVDKVPSSCTTYNSCRSSCGGNSYHLLRHWHNDWLDFIVCLHWAE